MSANRKYTYQDFWEMRGKQTIWVSRNFSYRAGAAVAWFSSKVGITPNMISVMSASITLISSILAVNLGQSSLLGGVIMALGLQIGYAFDCADGPLARATGQGSSFGAISDKIADLSSGMLLPCVLAYGAGGFQCMFIGNEYDVSLGLLVLFLTFRSVLCVLMWLKEQVMYKTDRLREDTRERNLWWSLKKSVSLYIDEPVYRLGIALAWSLGLFWEFIIQYGLGIVIITILYIISSKKEMDGMDREKSRSLGV